MSAGSETAQSIAKIAKLEAQVEFLTANDEQLRKELKETAREFRETLEDKSRRTADTFWKIVAAVLALAAIISNAITAYVVARVSS